MPVDPAIEDRIRMCERPSGRVAMHQNWRDLLFAHWKLEPEAIQATLPPGLYVDTYDGSAWLALVPFLMRDIRPPKLFAVPPISNFLEMNVRTYVYDEQGRPGVWFYSLDANNPLAVFVAQKFFHLPYLWADMSEKRSNGNIHYSCHRKKTPADEVTEIEYSGTRELSPPEPGSFEYFLVERYLLYTWIKKSQRLFTGRVYHTPYPVYEAEVGSMKTAVLDQAGFPMGDRSPDHVIFSPGVDVDLYSLEPA